MTKFRKWLIVLLSVCITVLCGAAIVACSGSGDWRAAQGVKDDGSYDRNNPNGDLPFYYPEGTDPNEYADQNSMYTIHTVSLGGMPIDGVKITVSHNGVDLIEGRSANGGVVFNIAEGEYDLRYDDLPNGYYVDKEATLMHLSKEHEVTTAFGSAVIKTSAPNSLMYRLGDVMYDFRVTNAKGETVVLSEILETKRLVMLNFWYTTCSWCLVEFPHLGETYLEYQNDVEIVALDDVDSPAAVRNFQNSWTYGNNNKHLEFTMAYDTAGVADRFGINAYPTSIFIDRYGVIAYSHGYFSSAEDLTALFDRFIADDYKQDPGDGGDPIGDNNQQPTEATPPPADIDPLPSDQIMTQAFLDASMLSGENAYADLPLHFRGPDPTIESEAKDAEYSWPFTVGQDAEGNYIAPSNIGTYNGQDTDNTYSILITDIDLEENETLTVEYKLNTQESADVLYIYINRSADDYFDLSGNTNGWREITLYRATRYTRVNIILMYVKSATYTAENEFVGLRNLKISPSYDENTTIPTDVLTEAAKEVNGKMQYAPIYLGADGFYHVYTVADKQQANDPILFTDVIYETLWSDRHIPGYQLVTYDGVSLINSVYNISYWLFNPSASSEGDNSDNNLEFYFGKEHTTTIIDSFYIQTGTSTLVPVSAKVRAALEAFATYSANASVFSNYYKNGLTGDTWLEMCRYYRTVGGDHTAAGHRCLATTNPGAGRILEYAIPLELGTRTIDTTAYTMKNRAGGLFYQFTATKAGVYKIESANPANELVDPKIFVWGSVNDDPFKGDRPIAEVDESLSVTRMKNYSSNFTVILYLKAGQTVYPQLTTSSSESPGKYDVVISYMGESHYELEIATTGEGMWTAHDEAMTDIYYIAVSTIYDSYDDRYYHNAGGEAGSVMYIDFLNRNFYDDNGHSLKDMIDRGMFNIAGAGDYTGLMNSYYQQAISKDRTDPTYGMVEADKRIVDIICVFTLSRDADGDSTVESGIWKAFACYYHYYGATAWEEMPED